MHNHVRQGLRGANKGAQVYISTNEGEFEGIVHSNDARVGNIGLSRVVIPNTGKKLFGVRTFAMSDIEDIRLIQGPKVEEEKDKAGKPIFHKKQVNPHLSKLKSLDYDSLLTNRRYLRKASSNDNNENSCTESCDEDDNKLPPLPDPPAEEIRRQTPNYTIIDQIDGEFNSVIHNLLQEHILGISMEGIDISRNGTLCWLNIATKTQVYMFDAVCLGDTMFNFGMKDVLESATILKIIHDSRRPSDMLYHKYGVQLRNVFDTQVAAIHVYKLKHKGDTPRYVSSLAECLVDYMNMNPNYAPMQIIRENCRETDESVWNQRPMPKALYILAWKNVFFLFSLRTVLMERMMVQFIRGVDIYLTCLRDAKEEHVTKANTHLVPDQFKVEVERNERYTSPRQLSNRFMDDNGHYENCNGLIDKNVVYSHDSLWHADTRNHSKENDPLAEVKRNQRQQVIEDIKGPSGQFILNPAGTQPPTSKKKSRVVNMATNEVKLSQLRTTRVIRDMRSQSPSDITSPGSMRNAESVRSQSPELEPSRSYMNTMRDNSVRSPSPTSPNDIISSGSMRNTTVMSQSPQLVSSRSYMKMMTGNSVRSKLPAPCGNIFDDTGDSDVFDNNILSDDDSYITDTRFRNKVTHNDRQVPMARFNGETLHDVKLWELPTACDQKYNTQTKSNYDRLSDNDETFPSHSPSSQDTSRNPEVSMQCLYGGPPRFYHDTNPKISIGRGKLTSCVQEFIERKPHSLSDKSQADFDVVPSTDKLRKMRRGSAEGDAKYSMPCIGRGVSFGGMAPLSPGSNPDEELSESPYIRKPSGRGKSAVLDVNDSPSTDGHTRTFGRGMSREVNFTGYN